MTDSIIRLTYLNSADSEFSFELDSNNPLQNLMEIIRDHGYEDWGECRGRAWCRTCHIRIEPALNNPGSNSNNHVLPDEEVALGELETRYPNSRLACQVAIEPVLKGAKLIYVGDN